jgi:hypothetical protein
MSYELPDRREYSWGNGEAFGNSTTLHYIVGPKGKVGYVRDISVDLTAAAVGTTTVPEIDVGTSSSDSTYGRYRLGTTAILGYPIGVWSASNEVITGNPPRNLQDYAHHVELDGYPESSTGGGAAGGTFLTVVKQGRIPASGMPIVNVISGTGSVWRVFLRDPLPYNLAVGQLVNVRGVTGVTGGPVNLIAISALSATAGWIELTGITFGGTYAGGGIVDFVTVVTEKAGTGGSPAGTGTVKVVIDWDGAMTP